LAVTAWTAWISAIVIAIFSLAATIHFAEWEEWVALVGGEAARPHVNGRPTGARLKGSVLFQRQLSLRISAILTP
jgi:hypothetical protein